MFTFSRIFSKSHGKQTHGSGRRCAKTRHNHLGLEHLEARTTPTASVFTDLLDYQPGATAYITAQDFAPGSTVEFQVLHVNGNNGGQGHLPWRVTDGSQEDLDHTVNGVIKTSWYVNPDDSLGEAFVLTALGNGLDMQFGTADDESASTTFTDGPKPGVTLNQWETLTHKWANGQANANQARYLEGDTVPFAAQFTSLTAGQNYGFVINLNTYQQNTNAGGFLFLDPYTRSVKPGTNAFGSATPLSDPALVTDQEYAFQASSENNAFSSVGANVSLVDIKNTGVGSLNRSAYVQFTATASTAVIYWGERLALPGEVIKAQDSLGNPLYATLGAAGFTGGSLQTKIEGSSNSGVTWITPSNAVQLMPGVVVEGSISGVKWNDQNANGVQDPGEALLGGWTIELYADSNGDNLFDGGDTLVDSMITGDGGAYQFIPVVRGTYFVKEVAQAGWNQTYPDPLDTTYPNAYGVWGPLVVDEITYNHTNIDFGNLNFSPDMSIDKLYLGTTGGNGNVVADRAGDLVNYRIVLTNLGNVPLTNIQVTDRVESYAPTSPAYSSGDTNGDGRLDVGEQWIYNYSYILTQTDLNGRGGGDGLLNNIATATSTEFGPVSDNETVPLVYNLDMSIDKVFTGVTGGNGNPLADHEGDVLNYRITVGNPGNITLTNIQVVDRVESYGITSPTYLRGDTNSDGIMDPNEAWIYSSSYTLTQADLDGRGNGNGYLDNLATASSTQFGSISDTESVELVYNTDLLIDKRFLRVSGGNGNLAADVAGDILNYQISVSNAGNVTQTGIQVVDQVESQGITSPTYISGDIDSDNQLDVGEVWVYTFSYTLTQDDLDGRGVGDGYLDNTATVRSDQHAPVSDSERVQLVYNPMMVVRKNIVGIHGGNGNVLADWAGDILDYEIYVANAGNITLTGIQVRDQVESYASTIPTYVGGDDNGNGTLDVGERWAYTLSYLLTQADLDGQGGGDGFLNNTVTATSRQYGPVSDIESVRLVYNPDFVIAKDVRSVTGGNGNGLADWAGDVITYQIGIQNRGNITLTGVTILDQVESYGATGVILESGDTNGDGNLDVGESWLLRATYTLTQADLDNRGGGDGYLDNVVTGNTREVGPKSDRERLELVYSPSFAITKRASVADGTADEVGDVINYVITLQNTGNISLTGVSVRDQVEGYAPTGASYVSGDTSNLGVLDVGETWVYSASYTLTQADLDNRGGGNGLLDNTATGDTAETTPLDASASVPLVYNPNFVIAKDVRSVTGGNGNGFADWAGDVITYQIGIQNFGNITLTGVTILDQVESYGATGVILESGDTNGDGNLDVGESWLLRASYTLTQADLDNRGGGDGYLDNVVTGNTREVGPKSDRERLVLVYSPDFAINKDVESVTGGNGNGVADWAGDQVNYLITLRNTGNISLNGVTVDDQVEAYAPSGATYISGDTSNPGVLDVGESWVYGASYTLTQADLDNRGGGNGILDNTATGDTLETSPRSDSERVPLAYQPALSVIKTGAWVDANRDGLANPGETIEYRFSVINTGNITLHGITLTDLVGGVTVLGGPLAKLGVGETDSSTFTGVYTLTQADIDAGHFYNVALADSEESPPARDDEDVRLPQRQAIAIDKVTADGGISGDGLTILTGEGIRWIYTVTNPGNVSLSPVTVSDNQPGVTPEYQSGDSDGDGRLDPDETWLFLATGTAVKGDYRNTGTASGGFLDRAGAPQTVSASDGSGYFGAEPGVRINKVTVYGGTEGDGLHIPSGAALEWKYSVTNTGNVPLAGIQVLDDNGTAANMADDFFATYFGGDDGDGVFGPGETWVFKASGVSLGGEYTNIGTATGSFTDDAGHVGVATARDSSSYIGDLQFTTVTLGGWGAPANGNNPGTYLNSHFASAFGSAGLVVPRNGAADIRLRNPDDVRNFLRATNNSPFTGVNVDGGAVKNYKVSTLEKQFVALTLNVRFDDVDANFGASSTHLGDLRLHDLTGTLMAANGLTVREVLGWTYQYLDGNKFGNPLNPLGGLSLGDLTMLVDLLNNSFEGGHASTWAMGHLA